ncbi:MAG: Crp/Fnr family transcriptional regulator [Clostridium sp.]|nr:Crp/Fnr family transcriptional regulator [Clostridium sp.]
MERSMFETLLELPLFQGICLTDLTRIVETEKLAFEKYEAGECLIKQDTPCHRLVFLTKGTITKHTVSTNRLYAVSERISAPAVLQPEALYGLNPTHYHSYTAKSDVNIMAIEKKGVNNLLMQYEVFRINMQNYMSTKIQRVQRLLWGPAPSNVEQSIVRFLRMHIQHPAGEKILHIKMEDLGEQIKETRLNVSRALNRMQNQGLVLLKRKEIIIPAYEKLQAHYF